jgi:putative hemolysin
VGRTMRQLQYGLSLLLATAFFCVWVLGNGSRMGLEASSVAVPFGAGLAYFVLASLVIVLILNGLFVACETAVTLLKPMHVKQLKEKEKTDRQGSRLQRLLDSQGSYVAACKLGSDVARLILVLLALVLAPGLAGWFGWNADSYWDLLAAAAVLMIPLGVLNLIVEQVPRSYAVIHPHGVAYRLFRFIKLTSYLFALPARLVTSMAGLITARFGGRAGLTLVNQAEEEIKTIVETAQETGEIEIDEKEMLVSVFEFTDTVAREVMTPRVDLYAVGMESDPEQVMELIRESGHSRIPLYENTDDQIVGIIHAKDLLMSMLNGKSADLKSLMRPALFVPENKNLHELLAEMRANRSQMAIVQDEFGGTAGIVTIEDIVEELVGDIVDEYDIEEPEVVQVSPGVWLADGKTHIDDVNDEVGSEFSSGEFDTIGGLVFGAFGRQAKGAEHVDLDGYRFTVVETDGRRIHRLQIEKLPEDGIESA